MFEERRTAPEYSARRIVYVIGPDESIRKSVRALLGTLEVDVATFASAEEFLKGFDPCPADCVITEARLPGISGLDLQRSLTRSVPDLPVIILDGRSDIRRAADFSSEGAFDIVEKPFADPTLLRLVSQALSKAIARTAGCAERGMILDRQGQ
jgi:two-component system response regulator FixJ